MYPTLVQGEYAKDSIVTQLEKANNDQLVDVIILGRGGGSIEDLWPFNEEAVAHAIYNSAIPIISSVGHETDFTISDFVADLRAPTPSGGAELAVPNQADLLQYLMQINNQNTLSLKRLLKRKQDQLSNLQDSYVLRDPMRITEGKSQTLDHLIEKLELLNPISRVKESKKDLSKFTENLQLHFKNVLTNKTNQYVLGINKLELLNPLSIMKKGYSVVQSDGVIIKSVDDIEVDSNIDVLLHDGKIEANVLRKKKGR